MYLWHIWIKVKHSSVSALNNIAKELSLDIEYDCFAPSYFYSNMEDECIKLDRAFIKEYLIKNNKICGFNCYINNDKNSIRIKQKDKKKIILEHELKKEDYDCS